MSDTSIRAAVKTALEAITGIGKVYDYQRWSATQKGFLDVNILQSGTTKTIHGWMITRTGAELKATGDDYTTVHKYKIIGVYGLKDSVASEKLFNPILDLVLNVLANISISGVQAPARLPQAPTIEIRMFGEYLCHYAEINWIAEEDTAFDEEAAENLTMMHLDYYLQEPEDDELVDASDEITY